MKTNALDKDPITPGTCEWCGKICEMEDVACCLSCEAQLHRLEAAQGRLIVRTLKRWRKYRGSKGTPGEGAMTEVAKLVDGFLRTDRLRRERFQAARREAAKAPEPKVDDKGRKIAGAAQTAAPVTSQPEDME